MYSVVLAMALLGGAEAPDSNWFNCGCFGGGWGGGCYGRTNGCYGGWNGGNGYGQSWGGYQGCYGGTVQQNCGCYDGGLNYQQGTPARPMPEPVPNPKKEEITVATPGTLLVTVPANTRLTVDSYVTQPTLAVRTLVTPPIPPGEEFTYTLVAESIQQGQLVRQSQQVTIRPGQLQTVAFSFTSADIVGH